jgi:hypothetical protein
MYKNISEIKEFQLIFTDHSHTYKIPFKYWYNAKLSDYVNTKIGYHWIELNFFFSPRYDNQEEYLYIFTYMISLNILI